MYVLGMDIMKMGGYLIFLVYRMSPSFFAEIIEIQEGVGYLMGQKFQRRNPTFNLLPPPNRLHIPYNPSSRFLRLRFRPSSSTRIPEYWEIRTKQLKRGIYKSLRIMFNPTRQYRSMDTIHNLPTPDFILSRWKDSPRRWERGGGGYNHFRYRV